MCTLKQKLEEWTDWLTGDDIHSIRRQLSSMIWDTAVFLMINESRKLAPKDKKNRPIMNGPIHNFIDRGFVATQSMYIRRLLDQDKKHQNTKSLRSLIENIKKHHDMMTREDFLKAHDVPYNYEEERKKFILRELVKNQI